jgi:hypothetical protein
MRETPRPPDIPDFSGEIELIFESNPVVSPAIFEFIADL